MLTILRNNYANGSARERLPAEVFDLAIGLFAKDSDESRPRPR